jgi:hypothetical protein
MRRIHYYAIFVTDFRRAITAIDAAIDYIEAIFAALIAAFAPRFITTANDFIYHHFTSPFQPTRRFRHACYAVSPVFRATLPHISLRHID